MRRYVEFTIETDKILVLGKVSVFGSLSGLMLEQPNCDIKRQCHFPSAKSLSCATTDNHSLC